MLATEQTGITLRVLYDNCAHDDALQTDWGFSCLVTGTERSILFDTGAKGDLLLQNMAKMSVSPDAAEVAVISHDHGDHTGGLIGVLEKNGKMTVYLPSSCPETMVQQVEKLGAKVITVTKPVEICRGVFVIGPTGDKIIEQALAVDTSKGLVLITGCSHPGVVEIAKRAKEQLRRDVYMVCGGMHLLEMPEEQISEVTAQLKSLGVQKVGPTHCTGEKAIALFKAAFGDGFVDLGVGRVLEIGIATHRPTRQLQEPR
ncbi:MAG: MBL fold metallo-hydrolase [Pirellulaceae bacterium]